MDKQIFVTRPSMPTLDEYIDEIRDIWESHWLTNMGVKHQAFQRDLEEYLGVPNIELVTNGHMALELSLQAMDISGEVITTPFTFVSTTHAIVRNGLKPVFCDINEDDYTIDVSKIEQLITEKTSAILPVHVYGNVCDVEAIDSLAKKYGLKVLYDAAHAFGVKYKNIGIGSFGDASCFSFHATKVFNSIEGGAISHHDNRFGLDLYRLKNFGIRGPEKVDAVGANAKMNEFCAAMGICNLRHISDDISKRENLFYKYKENLINVKGLRLPKTQKNVEHNYSYFPIIVDEKLLGITRDELYMKLYSHGIYARKYFYPLTSDFDCYSKRDIYNSTPVAKYISDRILTLPLYSELNKSDVDLICRVIKS